MAFDVFISYPHQNKAMADATCAKLEAEGIRCWIAPRDIAPSADWAASIVDAIDACRVMVLIFSGHTNRSRQVSREVQQAFDGEKPVIPFRIEDVTPERSLRYYMGSVHWLDAITPPVEHHLERLAFAVASLLRATPSGAGARKERRPQEAESREPAEPGREEKWRAAKAYGEPAKAELEPAPRPARRWIWAVAAIAGPCAIGAMSYYLWSSWPVPVTAYSKAGNFACFADAEYPASWRDEAPLCTPYGCNFGKMSRDACLALGAGKHSKTVIHGNMNTSRTNECWLQHSCGDLRPHPEFTLFKM